MTGSVQVKGKYCYIVLSYQGEQGRRRQKWISTHLPARGHKREAQRMIPEVIQTYQYLEEREPDEMDIVQLLHQWYQTAQTSLAPSTMQGYQSVLQQHLLPYFEKQPVKVSQVTPFLLEAYYQQAIQKGLSPTTVHQHHSILSAALRLAVRRGWLAHHPASQVLLPKQQPYLAQYYTAEQLLRLFTLVCGTELETPVLLAGTYGLRRSEVLALRWQDVQHGVLSVCCSVQELKGNLFFRTQLKTPSSTRALPLTQETLDYLQKLRSLRLQQEEQWRRQGIVWDTEHLCLREDGQLLRPSQLSKQFSRFLAQHQLPHIRFHDLRHSCASLLISNGCPVKAVQTWLGHSSYRTTADIYAHVNAADGTILAEVLHQQLGRDRVEQNTDGALENG